MSPVQAPCQMVPLQLILMKTRPTSWTSFFSSCFNPSTDPPAFRPFSPHCSPSAIMTLYRAQVLPILNYGCIIWDPQKDSALLESVQLFAAWMATKSWNANAVFLNSKLYLTTRSSRRAYFKVLYVLNGYLYCPPGLLNLCRNKITTSKSP